MEPLARLASPRDILRGPRLGDPGGPSTRIACLLKAVPAREEMPVDPVRRSVDRGRAELLLNPFDGRALGAALALRRRREVVLAISMGPPATERILTDAVAAGADRALLVSDPALAGSDTLVTAEVLARTLRALDVGLAITGAFSTDSGTGQVGPEIAGRLGWPVVTHARSVFREEDGAGLRVERDQPPGWERLRLEAPAVLAVGEKIGKPPKPAPADGAAPPRPVARWSLRELGLSPEEVGAAGSPSSVTDLRPDAPRRKPTIYRDGPPEERVASAWRSLPNASAAAPEEGPLRDVRGGGPVWVLVTDRDGAADPRALPLLSESRRALPEARRIAVTVSGRPEPVAARPLAVAGAQQILRIQVEGSELDPERIARALDLALTGSTDPAAILAVSDPFGRETAGLLAARRRLGAVGDATGFGPDGEGGIVWEKPSFGGEYLARITVRGAPAIATIRPGAFRGSPALDGPVEIEEVPLRAPVPAARVHRTGSGTEGDPADGELESARVVVTVGMGVGGPDGIERIRPFVRRWGAALGATRRVVDAGWLPAERQVGLTGHYLAPETAILLGVGKGANHVVGLRRARRILAINPDPAAPVFPFVDAAAVARWEEALPVLDRFLTPSTTAR